MWSRRTIVQRSWAFLAMGAVAWELWGAPRAPSASAVAEPVRTSAPVVSWEDEPPVVVDAAPRLAVVSGPVAAKVAAAAPAKVVPAFAPVASSLDPRVRSAYERAAGQAATNWPACHLRWTILAGVGAIESAHGAFHAGAIILSESGRVLPLIIGPVLDGRPGVAAIRDRDGGLYDNDPVWDRAVGPMQFLPSTWRQVGLDGNGDGTADPHSIDDAALTAARYLCAGGRDLATEDGLASALFSYNRSDAYVRTVRAMILQFDAQFGLLAPEAVVALPTATAGAPGASTTSTPTTASPNPPSSTTTAVASPRAPSTTRPTGTVPSTTVPSTTVAPTTTTIPPPTTVGPPSTAAPTTTIAPTTTVAPAPTTTTTVPPTTTSEPSPPPETDPAAT